MDRREQNQGLTLRLLTFDFRPTLVMMPAMRNLLGIALVLVVASCGNLTCSQSKKDSIKHHNKGVEALRQKTYSVAVKEFETAVNLDPENHIAAYHLGEAFVGSGDHGRAADAYLKAVKGNDKDPMYHYKLGKAYMATEKWDMARQALEKAIALNNRMPRPHWFLGEIAEKQDRPADAAKYWTEAARLDPGFGKPFYKLGKLYYEWDFLDQAISVLEQGGQHVRDPEDKTNIYHQLGMAYQAKKEYDKAVDAYAKAIEASGGNIEARLMMGMAYADKGDKANAKKYLDEFIKLGGGGNPFNIQNAHERLLKIAADY